jgi:hypothetical protein
MMNDECFKGSVPVLWPVSSFVIHHTPFYKGNDELNDDSGLALPLALDSPQWPAQQDDHL